MFRRRLSFPTIAAVFGLTVSSCTSAEPPAPVERSAIEPTTTVATTPPTSTTVLATTTTEPPAPDADLLPADSPAELAVRVAAAERTVRDPGASDAEVAAAAFEQQLLYRQLGRTPEWDDAVLAAAPVDLQLAIRNNAYARREFRAMHSKLSDTLPAWRIVDPVPADELVGHYQHGEKMFGVPWEILAAVNLVETGLGRIRGTSVAGAQGPMQFMPRTWAAFGAGGDINDTHDAIMGAARYLAHNGGGRGEIDTALWNYNHSDRYVRGVKYYAEIIAEDPAAFRGFYHWQIVYLSQIGDIWMPTGYEATDRVPVVDFVAAHPDQHLGTATD